MPYKIRKVRNKSCYKLYQASTKKVYSKCSTMKNAKSQFRLLTALKYNPKFRKNYTKKYRKSSRTTSRTPSRNSRT